MRDGVSELRDVMVSGDSRFSEKLGAGRGGEGGAERRAGGRRASGWRAGGQVGRPAGGGQAAGGMERWRSQLNVEMIKDILMFVKCHLSETCKLQTKKLKSSCANLCFVVV